MAETAGATGQHPMHLSELLGALYTVHRRADKHFHSLSDAQIEEMAAKSSAAEWFRPDGWGFAAREVAKRAGVGESELAQLASHVSLGLPPPVGQVAKSVADLHCAGFTSELLRALQKSYPEVVQELGIATHATARPPAAPPAARPIRRPPDEAFIAWRLRDFLGLKTQGEIADRMSAERGRPIQQYQVSRWLKQVQDYLAAGNILPEMQHITRKPVTVDPKVIEWGKRQDGRTKRQRGRRDDDEEE